MEMRDPKPWRSLAGALILAVAVGVSSSCAAFRSERCYVEDWQYDIAYNIFVQTGSIQVVRRRLTDLEWRSCSINECMYRLRKEFEVVSEGS